MVQVVTNENIGEFIANRKVAEFVAPKATDPTPEKPPVSKETSANGDVPRGTVDNNGEKEQPRDPVTKQFVKANGEDTKAAEVAKTTPADDDEDDADLPERVRRQIGKKHRQMREAEEFARERDSEAAKEKARADALEKRLAALETKSGPNPPKSDGAPKPEDFKTVGEYAAAVAKFEVAESQRKRDEADAEKRSEAEAQRARDALAERITATAKEIPDYHEVVGAVDTIVPGHMALYIAESELGPLIGYHLAKHPEELERLSKLSPIRAVAELGKLETKLETKAAPAEKPRAEVPPISRAPSPIAPLDTGGTAAVTKDPANMSLQELRAHRQAERMAGKR